MGSRIFVIAIALLTAGCTAAQMKAQQISNNTKAAGAQLQACVSAVYNAPENAPIRVHLPFNAAQPSLEQLTATEYLSDADKPLAFAMHDGYANCRKNLSDQLIKATPTLVPILAAGWAKSDDLVAELIQKKITWGDFVKQGRDLANATNAQLVAEGQRIDSGLAQENQAELAARQRAFAAFAQYEQNQEIINNMNRPVMTNCVGTGYAVNCISH